MNKPAFLRCLSLALALILVAAAVPVSSLAAETATQQIVGTDVTLDETRFEHTGLEIRPNVTVRVAGQLLTLDKEYTLEYRDNVEVGTAAVIVTGIATGGYTGTVEVPFYIDPKTSGGEDAELVTIVGTDVTIDGTEFPYTGEAIEPAVTVTVGGKVLTAGEAYTLVYENNIQPGTASVTVTGIAGQGYTGAVTIHFTILPAPETPTEPEETNPEETEPEETEPEETKPEETKPVSYQITKGNGSRWHKNSGKTLSFTADGNRKDFTGITVNGKTVNSQYYTLAEDSMVLTLKETFLQRLDIGKYTVSIRFSDGAADGTFQIAAPADDSNPKTGDGFGLHLLTALLFVSLTGLSGVVFACRKKNRK